MFPLIKGRTSSSSSSSYFLFFDLLSGTCRYLQRIIQSVGRGQLFVVVDVVVLVARPVVHLARASEQAQTQLRVN